MNKLIDHVRENFQLDVNGIHGVSHWSRVALNGRILHQLMPEVDLHVTQLFAFTHDSQRMSEGKDDEQHGERAADWIIDNLNLFDASPSQLNLLLNACRGHTGEIYSRDLTVQACWDADRLDIGRCKLTIEPMFLGTAAARRPEVMLEALRRSRQHNSSPFQIPVI